MGVTKLKLLFFFLGRMGKVPVPRKFTYMQQPQRIESQEAKKRITSND